MKLHEKIIHCRKKMGLSQEGLAQQLGVSRQAISKWETGDAVPELNKLSLLSNTFGVTTDWLLNENQSISDLNKNQSPYEPAQWIDALPGLLKRFILRFGWLAGVYIAVTGAISFGMGAIARYLVHRMTSQFLSFDKSLFDNGFSNLTKDN